jgi:hypothetical protein
MFSERLSRSYSFIPSSFFRLKIYSSSFMLDNLLCYVNMIVISIISEVKMGFTMREESNHQTGPFPLQENRTEREISHPGRVRQNNQPQKPEIRPADTEQTGDSGGTTRCERQDGQSQAVQKKTRQPEGQKTRAGEATASLRLIRGFFGHKCGRNEGLRLLTPLMR